VTVAGGGPRGWQGGAHAVHGLGCSAFRPPAGRLREPPNFEMLRVGRTARGLAAAAGPAWWQRIDAAVVPFAARASYDALGAAPHLSRPLHSRLWPHAATRTLRTSVALHQQIVTSGPRDVTLKKGSKLRVKVTHPPKAPTICPSAAPCGGSSSRVSIGRLPYPCRQRCVQPAPHGGGAAQLRKAGGRSGAHDPCGGWEAMRAGADG
jgi:hypothetical protein